MKALIKKVEIKNTQRNVLMAAGVVFTEEQETINFVKFGLQAGEEQLFQVGVPIDITRFNRQEFNDREQLKIETFEILTEMPMCLIKSSPVSIKSLMSSYLDMKKMIIELDDSFKEVFSVIEHTSWYKKFFQMPAAMGMHHAYQHGLLEHSISTANYAYLLGNKAKAALEVDMPLLLFGALFHDIGKIHEYEINDLGELTGFSKAGSLQTHAVISLRMLEPILIGANFPNERIDKFYNLILSHHGKLEWGAIVPPRTIESIILSESDYIDSSVASLSETFNAKENEGKDQVWIKKFGGNMVR